VKISAAGVVVCPPLAESCRLSEARQAADSVRDRTYLCLTSRHMAIWIPVRARRILK